jgi:hypothetical protein
LWLVLVVLIAFGLRLWRLDTQELRGDEVFGYFLSVQTIPEIIDATLDLEEPHPVASYMVEHVWLSWAGHSEFALRFPGVWFGVLGVAVTALLGQLMGLGVIPVVGAALLIAASPYTIWHSQDARMYAMSLALTAASSAAAWSWYKGQGWRAVAAYVLTTVLALHTHYYAIFIVAAQNLFVLADAFVTGLVQHLPGNSELPGRFSLKICRSPLKPQDGRSRLVEWLGMQAAVALLFVPWLYAARAILGGYQGNGDSPRLDAALARTATAFVMGEAATVGERQWIALLAAAAMAVGVAVLFTQGSMGRRAAALLALCAVVPVIGTWLSALNRPIFDERYLAAAAPTFYLMMAAALSGFAEPGAREPVTRSRRRIGASWLSVGLVAGMLALGALGLHRYATDPVLSKTRGWRELAAAVERLSAGMPVEAVRIVQNYPDPTLWYYYRGDVEHLVLPPSAHNAEGADDLVAEMVETGVQQVILAVQPSLTWDSGRIAQSALSGPFRLVKRLPVGAWMLEVYARSPQHVNPAEVEFANGVKLAAYAIAPDELAPGGLVTVHLFWDLTEAELSGTETVFVQLLDPHGALAAQDDRPLVTGGEIAVDSPAAYGILVPETLVAGDYRLIMGLYDPGQEGAPRLLAADGGDHVELQQMTVTLQ